MNRTDQFKFGTTLSVEQKLVDFSIRKTTGSIELKPLRLTRHKNPPDISFRCFFNTKTSEWHGIPVGKNPDGTFKFKPIRISGAKYYNLENEQDSMEWHVVKDYYRIKGGAMERDPLFEVNDREAEANKSVGQFSKIVKAGTFIEGLNGNKLTEFGRLFGIDPNNNSPIIIAQMLLEIAKTKPQQIIEKMESDQDTQVHIILKRALATGIVKHSIDRGYVFKDGIAMGTTEKGAIEFLRKDIPLMGNIDMESKALDKFYHKPVEQYPKTVVEATTNTANVVVENTTTFEELGRTKTTVDEEAVAKLMGEKPAKKLHWTQVKKMNKGKE